ncbi:unnamed protein product, partial [Polarella glacialis]
DTGCDEHRCVLRAEGLAFAYDSTEPVLKGIDFDISAGYCVGLVGNNASGKTTLARLLIGKISANSGCVRHLHGGTASKKPTGNLAASAVATCLVGLLAVFCGQAFSGRKLLEETLAWHRMAVAGAVAMLMAIVFLGRRLLDMRETSLSNHSVVHISSDMHDKEQLSEKKTIEAAIGEVLPREMAASAKRERVIALLCAGGFQMYNQETGELEGSPKDYVQNGLRYGQLSGGQRHLIYILRCFARRPAVLLCDELLGGLDSVRQPRVLRMLKRLQEAGTAVLFISTELHQIRVACDALGFLHDGKICEIGKCDEVLEFSKHPATKDYVLAYRSLPGGNVIGGKLAEAVAGLAGDAALEGSWLD